MKYILVLLIPVFVLSATVEQLFNIQKVKVQKQVISKKIKNYGYVKVDESKIFDVTPRFSGYVEKLFADTMYKKVKKGEALVKVYSPQVYQAKQEYLNSLRYYKKVLQKGMLKSAKLKLELLGVSTKEINGVKALKKVSEYTTIYSPIDGYVFMKNINNKSAFKANMMILQIVNLDEVWVESKIYQEQIDFMNKTDKFKIQAKGIKEVFDANKSILYPSLDPKIATATLRLIVQNDKNMLFPGMYTNINAFYDKKEYLTLPSSAVIRKNNQFYAFVVGEYEGEYEPLSIDVEALDSNTYIVKSGLSEGDEVVNNALFMQDSDAQINGLY